MVSNVLPTAFPERAARRAIRCLRGRRGVSAIEFAMIFPFLLVILLGVFDLGNAFQQSMRLESAARAGAQLAFSSPRDTAAVANMVRANLTNTEKQDLDIKVNIDSCRCNNGTISTCDFSESSTCSQPAIVSIALTKPFRYVSVLSETILPNLSPVRGNVQVRLY